MGSSSAGTGLQYGGTAKALHWLMFLLIATAFGIGLWMAGLPIGPQRFKAVPLHKMIGVTILVLVLVRLLWRMKHPAPPLPVEKTIAVEGLGFLQKPGGASFPEF